MNKGLVALGVIVLVAVVVYVIVSAGSGTASTKTQATTLTPSTAGQSYVPVQMTDPPQVPAGTSSLVISYSSLALHTEGGAGSGWISANASGSIDLMALLNVSKTMGAVAVPNGTKINMVRFNISSAEITINGTTYNVTVPSSHVQVNLEQTAKANGTSSVLLSLSPAVVSILTSNATVFVMVPSVKAVVVPNGANQSSIKVGFQAGLNESVKAMIDESGANITVTNATLSSSGNRTSLSVTIKNNGNQSVTIRHIMLKGNLTVSVSSNAIAAKVDNLSGEIEGEVKSGSVCANVTAVGGSASPNAVGSENESPNGSANAIEVGHSNVTVGSNGAYNVSRGSHSGYGAAESYPGASETEFRGFGGESAKIVAEFNLRANASVCTSNGLVTLLGSLKTGVENVSAHVGMSQTEFRVMNFLAAANGTLMLPFTSEDVNGTGYNISAGASHTFTFNGVVSTGDGVITIVSIIGKQYKVTAGGDDGAYSSVNATDA